MTNLLKKGGFNWDEAASTTFYNLKHVMTVAPVLALPEFNKPLILEVDAFNTGVRAMVMQNRRPLAFMSQSLSKRKQGLSFYGKELISLLLAVDR